MRPTSLLTLVALLGSSQVRADWARIDDTPLSGGGCGNGGNVLLPVFDNDSFDKVCADLVKDGCAHAFVLGKANVGSGAFAHNKNFDCADVAPAGEETCTNTFKSAYTKCSTAYTPGEKTECSVAVFNANGDNIGTIAFAAECLPAPMPPK